MPFLSTHIFKKICSFLSFLIYLHRCVEILVFLSLLRENSPSLAAGSTPSVCSLRSQPAPPRGRLMVLPQSFPPLLKPSPWTDSPRPGRDVALATEWGAGGIAAGDDGRGTHTKSTASLCGKRCFFQPFSARMWKTRCSFSSSYWWGP